MCETEMYRVLVCDHIFRLHQAPQSESLWVCNSAYIYWQSSSIYIAQKQRRPKLSINNEQQLTLDTI